MNFEDKIENLYMEIQSKDQTIQTLKETKPDPIKNYHHNNFD